MVVNIDGILTVLAATIGCYVGGTLLSLTIAVAIQRSLTAIGHSVYAFHVAGGRPTQVLAQILPPLAIGGLVCLALGWAAQITATGEASHRWLLVAAAALSVPVYFALARLLTPLRFAEASELLLSRLRRRSVAV